MEENVLLRMEGICKSFPGVKALDNAQLSVRAGTVHALMGENGAGKSTLMKCLFGIYSKDAGHIYLDGKEIDFKSSREALDNGVAMVHQELNQALKRTVMDNIWLGRYPLVKKGLPFVSDKQSYNDTKKVFDDLGINVNPRTVMSTMPVSQRQMVEIAKAVSFNSKVIVFDEPTSSLTETEVEHLFRIINMLKQRGCGIVYISHKMEEILRISDDVTIMRDGQWVATRPAKELTMDEIIRLMVGRPLTNRFPPKDNVVGDEDILKVEGLTAEYSHLKDANIHVRKGEILGVAGLDSSGRTELLENIFGSATRKSGKIYKNGKLVGNKTPRESIKNGFALVTEERRATGILGILDIRANTVIASLKKYLNGPFLSDKKMAEATDSMIKAMRIKTPSQQTKINTLSGGNQQKVIFGRWILTQPDVLLLDEPTRGIDVGAKYEIYQLIQDLAKQGKAVVMVSSEMPELLGVCNRIVVMSGGRVAGLTAFVAAILLQKAGANGRFIADGVPQNLLLVVLLVMVIGACIGFVNGFVMAKWKLHPYIITLAMQMITYGIYLTVSNSKQVSSLDPSYTTSFVTKSFVKFGTTSVPMYVVLAIFVTAIMWVVWNKTTFGKNMFAVGSNEEAARVSGVNVMATIIGVFMLAGALYGYTGFVEAARLGSSTATLGLNYEADAISAAVIGGVSFVGGTGKISGVILGVFMMQLIISGMTFLGISGNITYIIKGAVILIACILDMRKYMTRK